MQFLEHINANILKWSFDNHEMLFNLNDLHMKSMISYWINWKCDSFFLFFTCSIFILNNITFIQTIYFFLWRKRTDEYQVKNTSTHFEFMQQLIEILQFDAIKNDIIHPICANLANLSVFSYTRDTHIEYAVKFFIG